MKHGIQIKLPSFLLALAIVLSLCGCAVNPQELLNQLDLPQMSGGKGKESEEEPPEKEVTPSESTAPSESGGTQKPPVAPPPQTSGNQSMKPEQKPPEKNQGTFPSNGSSQNDPYNLDPPQYVETAEGKDSLIWLREKMNFPGMTFGAAYLGYVGGLFEEAFATGFPKWLQETNSGMLAEYPFIGEIGGERIIGRAGHLYCIVPMDKNATVAINRVYWNGDTQTEEITEVLYRSESGEPVLLFANLDDVPALADTQVLVTDSYGNTTSWYPCLDEQFHLVPTIAPDGSYIPGDFTEYGWQGVQAELSPWLAANWEGPTALGLAGDAMDGSGTEWVIRTTVRDTDRTGIFGLMFYPGDETGGMVDMGWIYDNTDYFEELWSGFWSIETVMEGPSYVELSLFLTASNGQETAETSYISETYPILISPSGLELLIGAGENGVCLPFMSQSTSTYTLTRADDWA